MKKIDRLKSMANIALMELSKEFKKLETLATVKADICEMCDDPNCIEDCLRSVEQMMEQAKENIKILKNTFE